MIRLMYGRIRSLIIIVIRYVNQIKEIWLSLLFSRSRLLPSFIAMLIILLRCN